MMASEGARLREMRLQSRTALWGGAAWCVYPGGLEVGTEDHLVEEGRLLLQCGR